MLSEGKEPEKARATASPRRAPASWNSSTRTAAKLGLAAGRLGPGRPAPGEGGAPARPARRAGAPAPRPLPRPAAGPPGGPAGVQPVDQADREPGEHTGDDQASVHG